MQAGQQYEQGQADLEYRQQAAAMQKMQLLAARQKMETDKAIGAELQAGFAGDKAAVSDPQKAASLYSNAARMAAARGDLEGMRQYEQMAQSEVARAQLAQSTKAAEQKAKLDGLANAAADFRATPSAEAAAAVIRNALSAGVPMQAIPDMRAPEFPAWVKRQEQAGMSAKDRLALAEKQREFDTQQQYRKEEDERRRQERLADDRRVAAFQREGLELRRLMVQSTLEQRAGKAGSTDPELANIGKPEMLRRGQAITAGGQITRRLEQMAVGFQPGDTNGPFAALKPGAKISESLGQLAATKITAPAAQAMQALTAGMAKDLGALLTAGEGGRGYTEGQVKALQGALAPAAGENALVSTYKFVNATEEVVEALKGQKHSDPEKERLRQDYINRLHNLVPDVTAIDVLKVIKKSGKSSELQKALRGQEDYGAGARMLGQVEKVLGKAKPQESPTSKTSAGVISADDWLKQ